MNPRVVVLTGVTRGLGRAMLEQFARQGLLVAGCGRTREAIQQIENDFHPPHRFTQVDVTRSDEVHLWAESVLEHLGPPDLLINNAALINRNSPLWRIESEEFDQVVDVNIKGVVNVLRAFVPAMIERGSGVIVNFSSYWGRSVAPEVAPYCATKWAIEGLTKAVAQELPSGLAAVPFNPGIIDTQMLRSCFGSGASAYPGPAEWARTAVPFLLKLGPRDNGISHTAPN